MKATPYYPDTGLWAVLARAAFLGAIGAVTFASLAPASLLPRLLASRHLEHFAAFYLTAMVSAAAAPRISVLRLAAILGLFAGGLELARMLPSEHRIWGALDWEADFGGIVAALAPVIIGMFRVSFARRAPD